MEKENLRPVRVERGKETFEAFFHGWTENVCTDVEDHPYVYKLAIVENPQNGEILTVLPERIRFTDRL